MELLMPIVVSRSGIAALLKQARKARAKPLDRELLRIDRGVMIRKLVVFVIILAAGWAAILSGQLVGALVGTLVVAAMFAHGVELTHQFLHGTGFDNRTANRVAGFLCALPMLVSHSHYRVLHLAHHRNLGTPGNREFFNYGNVEGRPFLIVLMRSFSPGRYLGVAKNMARALAGMAADGATTAHDRRRIRSEYLAMVVLVVAAITVLVVTRSGLLVRLWLIPLVVAESIHFWVELPEHFGCDLTTRNVLHNTRTIRGSWLSFWFTNGNNFHVEHHLYPRVVIDKLPRVHAMVRDDLRYVNDSYGAFLGTVLARKVAPVAVSEALPAAPGDDHDDALVQPPGEATDGDQPAARASQLPWLRAARRGKPAAVQGPAGAGQDPGTMA
jgi:fatty acid desaturase